MPSILVRHATPEDADTMAALNAFVQALHARLIPEIFKPASAETFGVSEMRAILSAPEHIGLLATLNGIPAGYALAEVRRKPERSHARASSEVYVHHMSVASAYQRQGVGSALLDAVAVEAQALGIERLSLDVWAANADASAFYAARGFGVERLRMSRGGWGVAGR
jgi:ribosomal protein S18 acetylase RimI-like enzyme